MPSLTVPFRASPCPALLYRSFPWPHHILPCLTAAAALHLLPVNYLWGDGMSVFLEDDGMLVFTSWMVRGLTTLAHFMAYNAGTSVLHIGPYREVVTESDKADLQLYALHLKSTYGVFVAETCVVRRLMVSPAGPEPTMIPWEPQGTARGGGRVRDGGAGLPAGVPRPSHDR